MYIYNNLYILCTLLDICLYTVCSFYPLIYYNAYERKKCSHQNIKGPPFHR